MTYFLFSFGKISMVAVVFLDLVKLGQILEHLPEIKSNAKPKASTISTTAMFDWIRLDQIGSDWIRMDQIRSDWIRLDKKTKSVYNLNDCNV